MSVLLKEIILLFFTVKLNGGRSINGILRGFDPFMNIVLDDTIEDVKDGSKNNIGMVVSKLSLPQSYTLIFDIDQNQKEDNFNCAFTFAGHSWK